MHGLSSKVAIVTGGARGNGQGIAIGLRDAGASVYCIDVLKGDGKDIVYYQADLTKKDEVETIINEIYDNECHIDILVNNAGVSYGNTSEYYSDEDWNNTLLINLTVPFWMSQMVGRKMIQCNSGGSIINITSLGAEFGFPCNPAYCASKGGLKQLTKALAYDWARYGIRVNNVGPGYMRTNMTSKSYNNPTMKAERDAHIMLGRWGEPTDLAGICSFLASDASNYITGQDIYVDGGWTAKGM